MLEISVFLIQFQTSTALDPYNGIISGWGSPAMDSFFLALVVKG